MGCLSWERIPFQRNSFPKDSFSWEGAPSPRQSNQFCREKKPGTPMSNHKQPGVLCSRVRVSFRRHDVAHPASMPFLSLIASRQHAIFMIQCALTRVTCGRGTGGRVFLRPFTE
jgi:hypothetical protein